MDTDRSIEIVQSLADGVDPYSGERFPSSSPYHQADTLHTLTNGMTDGYAVRMESSLGMNVASERTAWEYAVCSGQINDDDDPLETDPGGYACVCTNNLTPLNLKVQPTDLPGKVRLSATTGGQRIRLWENADRTGEVVLPKEWNSVTNVPSGLYVEGVTNSAAACDVTLALTYDENPPNQNNTLFKCEDKVRLTILSVDLTAYRPTTELPAYGNPFQRHEVPDDLEESPGAGIRVNGDTESSANENDLIEVQLDVAPFPVPSGLTCVLKRNNSNIKVWDSQDMSGSCLLDAAEAEITISSSPMSVWVENPNGGNADLELIARSGTTDVCSDKIHFYPFTSIVIALGGEEQEPTDPANANHGIFHLAIDLYEQGYDVHMYDEDNVDDEGDGATFDEVVGAIQHRSVNQVAIYGYSHGGGSTHDLAERLDNNRATIETFTIPFTAYIDAVTQGAITQENRRPPGSGYHVNFYQEGALLEDGGLDGGPIDNPPGSDFETDVDDPTVIHTHFTIDDDANILNGIETRLTPRVNR